MTETDLHDLAREVADALATSNVQLVLAESCTAGLVAATLGAIPGISQFLCGSAVVYQEATKTSWLGVSSDLLARRGAVSSEVASAMASGALDITPHATLAATITGHLGPNAPTELDGQLFVALQKRGESAEIYPHKLTATDGLHTVPKQIRLIRQFEAAAFLLICLQDLLKKQSPGLARGK